MRKAGLLLLLIFFVGAAGASWQKLPSSGSGFQRVLPAEKKVDSAGSQSEFSDGEFNGTSTDRNDNSGELGIGYRNGTTSDPLSNESLVGYWRLDASSDPLPGSFDVRDYSGSNQNGTTNGGITRGVKGILSSKAFHFDGSNSNIDTGIDENFQTGSFSISVWVNSDEISSDGKRIVADDDGTNGWALSQGDSLSGTVRFFVRGMDSIVLDTGDVINSDRWYHVVAVFDNANNDRFIYVNGTKEASILSDTGTPSTDSGPVRIGGEDSQRYYNGTIDEVRIYNRSLTQEEVKKLYLHGSSGKFHGEYDETSVSSGKPTKLQVHSDNVSSTGNRTWFNVSKSSEEDVVSVDTGDDLKKNYSLDISSTGGSVDVSVNMTSTSAALSPVVRSFTLWGFPEWDGFP